MGMHQVPLPATNTTFMKRVRACFFPAGAQTSRPISVFYRGDSLQYGRRNVLANEELMKPRGVNYVHDVIVNINYEGKNYTYRVFFRRYMTLPANQPIRNLAGPNVRMEGDLLVVGCGKRVEVRNLGGRQDLLAMREAVRRMARRLSPMRPRRSIPRVMNV
ncbi:hypothetical protein FB446DRAFT_654206 [Lentinula raphanica]|nr:hypothetical protein FB446DRAFT_654206 [Lentinula raphanica]